MGSSRSRGPRSWPLGGDLEDRYPTRGQFDAVAVTESPDAEISTRSLLSLLEEGIEETETLRAFDRTESRDLIGSL